jgi:hypothetical protein
MMDQPGQMMRADMIRIDPEDTAAGGCGFLCPAVAEQAHGPCEGLQGRVGWRLRHLSLRYWKGAYCKGAGGKITRDRAG